MPLCVESKEGKISIRAVLCDWGKKIVREKIPAFVIFLCHLENFIREKILEWNIYLTFKKLKKGGKCPSVFQFD